VRIGKNEPFSRLRENGKKRKGVNYYHTPFPLGELPEGERRGKERESVLREESRLFPRI